MSTTTETVHPSETVESVRSWVEARFPERKPPEWQVERRTEKRYPVVATVELIPLADDADRCIGPCLQVECRDVSRSGVRICLAEPLAYRTVGLALPLGDNPDAVWITRLKWCRYTADGSFESGGIFLRVVRRCDIQQLPDSSLYA